MSLLSQIPADNELREITIDLRIDPDRVDSDTFSALPFTGLDGILGTPTFDPVQKISLTVYDDTDTMGMGLPPAADLRWYIDELGRLFPLTGGRGTLQIYQLSGWPFSAFQYFTPYPKSKSSLNLASSGSLGPLLRGGKRNRKVATRRWQFILQRNKPKTFMQPAYALTVCNTLLEYTAHICSISTNGYVHFFPSPHSALSTGLPGARKGGPRKISLSGISGFLIVRKSRGPGGRGLKEQ